MAEAMIGGLIRQKWPRPKPCWRPARAWSAWSSCSRNMAFTTFADNTEAARQADVVVLSVKPQRLDRVLTA